MTRRFKGPDDEFTADEELAFQADGTVPDVDDDEREALRDAGWDPDNRDSKGRPRPLIETLDEECEARYRAAGYRIEEEKSMEDRIAEMEQANRVPGGLAP